MLEPFFLFVHDCAQPGGGIKDFRGRFDDLSTAVARGQALAGHGDTFHVIDARNPATLLHEETMAYRGLAARAQGVDLTADPEAPVPVLERETARALAASRRRPRRRRELAGAATSPDQPAPNPLQRAFLRAHHVPTPVSGRDAAQMIRRMLNR